MVTSDGQNSTRNVENVLAGLRARGVSVWSENGRLHYKAPKGTLSSGEVEHLKASKDEILRVMEDARRDSKPCAGGATGVGRAMTPLAYSQLAHWNLYRLWERPAARQIFAAMRVNGALDVDALQRSVNEIVRRHDALRTRIIAVDGVPYQLIDEANPSDFGILEFGKPPESSSEREVEYSLQELVLSKIDVAAGPLFGVRLLRLGAKVHVLLLAIEHIVSDAISMGVIVRDLWIAYEKIRSGERCSSPTAPVQFRDFAAAQRSTHSPWLDGQRAQRRKRLEKIGRLRWPRDEDAQTTAGLGWGAAEFAISAGLVSRLREWARSHGTTLVMSVFTAYVALLLRWCRTSAALVNFQCNGRESPDLENAVGYYAYVLYLHIEAGPNDTLATLLTRVIDAYCEAFQQGDSSYWEAQQPRPDFVRSSVFNWVPFPGAAPIVNGVVAPGYLQIEPLRLQNPVLKVLERDDDPSVLLTDGPDCIHGSVYFSLNRFSPESMQQFGQIFVHFIETLVSQPETCIGDVPFERV